MNFKLIFNIRKFNKSCQILLSDVLILIMSVIKFQNNIFVKVKIAKLKAIVNKKFSLYCQKYLHNQTYYNNFVLFQIL